MLVPARASARAVTPQKRVRGMRGSSFLGDSDRGRIRRESGAGVKGNAGLLAAGRRHGYDTRAMNSALEHLAEAARGGDLEPFNKLVAELRSQAAHNPALLRDALRSADELLRRAAVLAAPATTDPDVLRDVAGLVHDPSPAVRLNLAAALEQAPQWPLDAVAGQLLLDPDAAVRETAVRAARRRPILEPLLLERL